MSPAEAGLILGRSEGWPSTTSLIQLRRTLAPLCLTASIGKDDSWQLWGDFSVAAVPIAPINSALCLWSSGALSCLRRNLPIKQGAAGRSAALPENSVWIGQRPWNRGL